MALTSEQRTMKLPVLLAQVRSCTVCAPHLENGVRPILQVNAGSQILLAGQAPGRKVHASGVPFDDASGERLRQWMGIGPDIFYDAKCVGILPMGFCYPGTGKSGDLPPRKECAPLWRASLISAMPKIELVLVIGQFAIDWHLPQCAGLSLTETVRNWRTFWPDVLPLPHPSPRNNIWLKANPWFVNEVVPVLQKRVNAIFNS
jgi:uracil-DNA glycosylase